MLTKAIEPKKRGIWLSTRWAVVLVIVNLGAFAAIAWNANRSAPSVHEVVVRTPPSALSNDTSTVFVRQFEADHAGAFVMSIAADNHFVARINGEIVAEVTDTFSFRRVTTVELTAIHAGTNVLEVTVINDNAAGQSWQQNPGGLTFVIETKQRQRIASSDAATTTGGKPSIVIPRHPAWTTGIAAPWIWNVPTDQ